MKYYIKHGNYYGEVYYSEEDAAWVGVVLGFRGMIAYHGKSLEEAKVELIDSIEHYLDTCKEEGWVPNVTDPAVAREMEALLNAKNRRNLQNAANFKDLSVAV